MGGATNWPSALDWPLTDHPSTYCFLANLLSWAQRSPSTRAAAARRLFYLLPISVSIWLLRQMREPVCGWRYFSLSGHRTAAGQPVAVTIESTLLEAPCHRGNPILMSAGRGLEVSVRLFCGDGEPILDFQQQRFERIFCAWEHGEIEWGCAVERTNARTTAGFT
jgi:hypothetical protein